MKKIALSILLTLPYLAQSQTRLVINNNGYMVLDNSATLVIDNGNANAIITTGTGGNIISEAETNVVQWNIGNNTGTYTVPFTTSTTTTKIPTEVIITNAGSNDGQIIFSTYETSTDNNTPWASDVTNMNSGALAGANGSLFAVDRFWMIDANTYTTKPDINIALGYDDAANEMVGTNTITETNLVAQYFDSSTNIWEGAEGTANTVNDVVSPIVMNGADLFKTWTLVDNSTLLPINIADFYVTCENNSTLLFWELANTDKLKNIIIENSTDSKKWHTIEKLSGNQIKDNSWKLRTSSLGDYYRLKFQNEQSEETISTIVHSDCSSGVFDVAVYPNPTNGELQLKLNDSSKDSYLTIYNAIGELVLQFDLRLSRNHTLDISEFSKGTYHFFFYDDGGNSLSKSIVKL